MCRRIHLLPLLLYHVFRTGAALTNTDDLSALTSAKDQWDNIPPNWVGNDPCGKDWEGITCTNNRVISITLASINLIGKLSPDIGRLSALQILDLSYNKGIVGLLPSTIGNLTNLSNLILVGCGLTGLIPPSIGSLQNLLFLALNSNYLIGEIPGSIGKLSRLVWLDLSDNQLSGTIPVSTAQKPGLDLLPNVTRLHFAKNLLSGEIPSQLFSSKMKLAHLRLEDNQLTGSIPPSMGLVLNLTVVRLDKNSLSGPVPGNLNNLTLVEELGLANNNLTGPFPNLTGMNSLHYVDFSNNSFDATDIPTWFSSLQSLASLIMESTQIQGQLPVPLFSLSQLQTVVLKNNRINGTLNIGSSYSKQLQLIDLQNNFIDEFTQREGYNNVQIILVGNPICNGGVRRNYCFIPNMPNSSDSTPAERCTPLPCDSELKVPSPTCKCAIPYSGNLFSRAPSFSNFDNQSLFDSLEKKLVDTFKSHGQPVDSVYVGNPRINRNKYLVLNLQVFPSSRDYFNRTEISGIGFILSNQTFKAPEEFGPYFFMGDDYPKFIVVTGSSGKSSSSSKTVIIGATVGGSVLVLLLLVAGVYAFRQKRRAAKKSNPFESWDPNSDSGGVPQFKEVRCFSFEEIKKCTNNFSETNCVGRGGYGKVYRGTLPDGQLVAIKRAQQGSMQGRLEFKTEIELLSRVHHKNVVGLVGFCFDKGEQMLVYEYITNGTLKDSLTGNRLDWIRRVQIALGAARGLQYLHDLADPPIIHRDIKSNNILLDERLNAKVADFGLSKLMDESGRSYVITQVKGTVGYMDPEYYMSERLTEKSDVYSFGVLLLEILTSKTPIVKGKHIVKEVKETMDKTKTLYNLDAILDPLVASNMAPGSVERFVDLALKCVEDSGPNRPAMGEVVKEIENIMEMAGLNPNMESASTPDNYEGSGKDSGHPYEGSFSQGRDCSSTVLVGR